MNRGRIEGDQSMEDREKMKRMEERRERREEEKRERGRKRKRTGKAGSPVKDRLGRFGQREAGVPMPQ